MLRVELLKAELLKASPPVHCNVGCVGVRLHHNEHEETLLTIQFLTSSITNTQLIVHMATYKHYFYSCLFILTKLYSRYF
jgi:hypothetical protein